MSQSAKVSLNSPWQCINQSELAYCLNHTKVAVAIRNIPSA